MPRLTATRPLARPSAAPARPKPVRRSARKPAPPPDRLSARALFVRRLRRSLKPALGLATIGGVIVLGVAGFRAIPPAATVISPAGSLRHDIAAVAADAGFRISSIDVTGANGIDPAAIAAAMGVRVGQPILGVSLLGMQARLLQLGPVQTATVERALPDRLIVTIGQRAAIAIWQTTGPNGAPRFVLVDGQGHEIADQDAVAAKRHDPSLLLLTGTGAPANAQALLAALHAQPAILARVMAAEWVDGLRWDLILRDRALIKLPAGDPAPALAELANLQTGMTLLDRPVEVIDLRLPGRLIVRPYPAAAPPAAPPAAKAAQKTTEPSHE
jgi:cell division protein FtsQ